MGYMSGVSDYLVAVESAQKKRDNMIVCTLCSCYPWEVLGLPPTGISPRRIALAPLRTLGGRVGRLRRYAAEGH